MMYDIYVNNFSPNDIFALLNFKKNILKITLNLAFAIKKIS